MKTLGFFGWVFLVFFLIAGMKNITCRIVTEMVTGDSVTSRFVVKSGGRGRWAGPVGGAWRGRERWAGP